MARKWNYDFGDYILSVSHLLPGIAEVLLDYDGEKYMPYVTVTGSDVSWYFVRPSGNPRRFVLAGAKRCAMRLMRLVYEDLKVRERE